MEFNLGTLESRVILNDENLFIGEQDLILFELEEETNLLINGISVNTQLTDQNSLVITQLKIAEDLDSDNAIDDDEIIQQFNVPDERVVENSAKQQIFRQPLSSGNYLLGLTGLPGTPSTTFGEVEYSIELIPTSVDSSTNENPFANDDSYNILENDVLTVSAINGVLSNDTDLENDLLTVSLINDVDSGSLELNTDGSFSYIPTTGFSGVDGFTYQVSDGNGGTDSAAVELTVNPVNNNPIATDDTDTTDEDTAVDIDVLDNDDEPDGDPLSLESVTQGSNGSVAINPNGTVTYTPDADFNGTDSFTYTISDGNGGSNTADVFITVDAVNDAPNAVDDSFSGDEDTIISNNTLVNDGDPDGDPLSATLLEDVSNGSLSLNNDGSFTYTPDSNFNGIDSFTYQVSDGNGGVDSATVEITVNATGGDLKELEFNTLDPISGKLRRPEKDTFTFVVNDERRLYYDHVSANRFVRREFSSPSGVNSGSVFLPTEMPNNDSNPFTLIEKGNYQLVFKGLSFEEGTYSFRFLDVADAPEISLNRNISLDSEELPGIDLAGETDLYRFSISTNSDGDLLISDGEQLVPIPDGKLFINNLDDTVTGGTFNLFDPNNNLLDNNEGISFELKDFEVTLEQPGEYVLAVKGTDNSTFNYDFVLTTPAENAPPIAEDDTATTDEDVAIDIDVLNNDSDPDGDPLSPESVIQGSNGSARINSDGTIRYNPNFNFNGTDSFSYTISDGNGGTATATVDVTIEPVNDNPIAIDDTVTIDEDVAVDIDVLDNDSDPEGDPLSLEDVTQGSNGSVAINPNGTVSYTPNADFNGTDSFTYTISDGNGGTDSATVFITVETNRKPSARDDVYDTPEDTPLTVEPVGVLVNDTDPEGDPLIASLVEDVENGSLTFNSDGSFSYTPNADFNGVDSFIYQISDGNGGTDSATVSIRVEAINDEPDARDDLYDTRENTPLNVDPGNGVLINDTDPEGNLLTASLIDNVENGSLSFNPDGSFSYTPNAGFSDVDGFTYQISDGNGGTDEATVTIVVEDDPLPKFIDGTPGRDNLTGTNEEEIITGLQGPDIITTGQGPDTIVYTSIVDAGDVICDLEIGSDLIDLRGVLESVGFDGSDAIADGYISFMSGGSGTMMMLDADGNGSAVARPYLFVKNVTEAALNNSDNFISA